MLQAFQEFRLDHIFREGNKTTDALAKRLQQTRRPCLFLEPPLDVEFVRSIDNIMMFLLLTILLLSFNDSCFLFVRVYFFDPK